MNEDVSSSLQCYLVNISAYGCSRLVPAPCQEEIVYGHYTLSVVYTNTTHYTDTTQTQTQTLQSTQTLYCSKEYTLYSVQYTDSTQYTL